MLRSLLRLSSNHLQVSTAPGSPVNEKRMGCAGAAALAIRTIAAKAVPAVALRFIFLKILRAHATPCSLRGFSKEAPNFIVAGLVEVFVIESDGDKRLGRKGADDAIGDLAERLARLVCSDGHRDDDLRRIMPAQRGRRGAHRCTGGQPIVDEDHDLAGDVGLRTPVPIGLLSATNFFCLATDDVLNRLIIEAQRSDQIVVYDARSIVG